jgi:hypothetical protein
MRFNASKRLYSNKPQMFRYTPRDAGVWTFLTDRFPDFKMNPHCHEDHEINVCVRAAAETGDRCRVVRVFSGAV